LALKSQCIFTTVNFYGDKEKGLIQAPFLFAHFFTLPAKFNLFAPYNPQLSFDLKTVWQRNVLISLINAMVCEQDQVADLSLKNLL
jgi:hypothetical protein